IEPPVKSVPLARALLVCGGLIGLHKIYMNRLPEAFIRLSTLGMGLIGIFYDSFTLAADVDECNDEREKKGGRKGNSRVAGIVPFSMSRFTVSLIYAGWLGLLAWAAASLTYAKNDQQGGRMMGALTIAVTMGVYITGNCGDQRRSFHEIFLAVSGVLPVVMGPLLNWGPLQSVAVASSIGTIVGNRTAKRAEPGDDKRSRVHFVLWTSVFLMNTVLLVDGVDRQLLRREFTIETQSGVKSIDTVKLSVQGFASEWFFNPNKTRRRFKGDVEKPWQIKFTPPPKQEPQYLEYLGVQPGEPSPAWIEHLAGAVVDGIRAAAEDQDWVSYMFNRRYLVVMLEVPPLSTDVTMKKKCGETRRRKKEGLKKEEVSKLGLTTKTCDVLKL
ncbi:hypothetical protein PFISCL1PPCAC_18532, partial [Pristionchus fissidentatus]